MLCFWLRCSIGIAWLTALLSRCFSTVSLSLTDPHPPAISTSPTSFLCSALRALPTPAQRVFHLDYGLPPHGPCSLKGSLCFPPHLARASVRAFAFLVCLALFLAIRPAAAHPATLAPAQQASGATSQLTVSGTPRANGADLATITVTVRDGAGAPLANQTVWLTVSGSDNTLAGVPGTTDATGIAIATLQSTQAERKVIRARVGSGSSGAWLPGSAQVTFSGASISGTVFVDANQDGGQDAGESPLAGVQVALYSASGESALRSTVSDESGQYTFTTLTAGTYRVRVTPPGPYAPSQAEGRLVSVSAFESATDQDLGVYAAAHLRGTVWQDANADGLRQSGEAGLAEAGLYALDETEGLRASTHSA